MKKLVSFTLENFVHFVSTKSVRLHILGIEVESSLHTTYKIVFCSSVLENGF